MSQYIDFAFVKENASFERVLEHYKLVLRGRGAQRSALCPFHPDKRPSLRVELDKGLFHCFACEAKGNMLEFVARSEGVPDDLRAAAEKIADICKIPLAPPRGNKPAAKPAATAAAPKGRRPAEPAPAPAADTPVEPVAPINVPLTFTLKLDPSHPYLVERGLSAEQIAEFGLGYCSRGSMAGRICFPIHNEAGALVAYAGRWAADEVPEDVEKYKLPAKFEKHRVLYNLHRVRDAEHVVAVEGYWSSIRLHALGVPVVGLMGWSVSPEQIALLRDRGTKYLTLLWDGDAAGERARERVLPALASAFFVRAPVLPDGEKPDTLAEAELKRLIALP
ncbi:MAG TPA: CHC2 zinc finger domain-containing protein [Stellaceae bacterium]|nr:CHC2 zinc finger domain-containing protein [Stellaceae bacterium]